MPAGALPLHAGLDPAGTPCLWCLVDPERATAPLPVAIFGTGNPMAGIPASPHVGSFVQGGFVWHVFAGGT